MNGRVLGTRRTSSKVRPGLLRMTLMRSGSGGGQVMRPICSTAHRGPGRAAAGRERAVPSRRVGRGSLEIKRRERLLWVERVRVRPKRLVPNWDAGPGTGVIFPWSMSAGRWIRRVRTVESTPGPTMIDQRTLPGGRRRHVAVLVVRSGKPHQAQPESPPRRSRDHRYQCSARGHATSADRSELSRYGAIYAESPRSVLASCGRAPTTFPIRPAVRRCGDWRATS